MSKLNDNLENPLDLYMYKLANEYSSFFFYKFHVGVINYPLTITPNTTCSHSNLKHKNTSKNNRKQKLVCLLFLYQTNKMFV